MEQMLLFHQTVIRNDRNLTFNLFDIDNTKVIMIMLQTSIKYR